MWENTNNKPYCPGVFRSCPLVGKLGDGPVASQSEEKREKRKVVSFFFFKVKAHCSKARSTTEERYVTCFI